MHEKTTVSTLGGSFLPRSAQPDTPSPGNPQTARKNIPPFSHLNTQIAHYLICAGLSVSPPQGGVGWPICLAA